MIDSIAFSIFLLALVVFGGIYVFAMKTTELTTAVTNLTNATTALNASVDKAVAALVNQGGPSTPDSDIVPLIAVIDNQTQVALAASSRLEVALNPPTNS